MSGQQIGTVVGFAAGTFFGAPQAGAIIGGYIGGVISPTVIKGPSIGDAASQGSTEGWSIPKNYGLPDFQGVCLIDGDPIARKILIKQDAGKGSTTETEQEGFVATRAYLVCEGSGDDEDPVRLVRLRRNGKLVLSNIAGDILDADSAAFASKIRFYSGTQDQLPDPSLEAINGVDETQSYPGHCYFVVIDDDETQSGGRPNVYEAQVSSCGTVTTTADELPGSNIVASGIKPDGYFYIARRNAAGLWADVAAYAPVTTVWHVPAWGDGRWALARRSSNLHSDDDLATFSAGTSPNTGSSATCHRYGNGVFVLTGSSGLLQVGDGDVYADKAPSGAANYGQGGNDGDTWLIPAGNNWTVAKSVDNATSFTSLIGPYGFTAIHAIEFDNGVWVVGGEATGGDYRTKTFTDEASTGSFGDAIGHKPYRIRFGNGYWLMSCNDGKIMRSSDRLTWLEVYDTGNSQPDLLFDGERFFIALGTSDGDVAVTHDGSAFDIESTGLSGVYALGAMPSTLPDLVPIPDAPGYYTDYLGQIYNPSRTVVAPCSSTLKTILTDIFSRVPAFPLDRLSIDNMTDVVPGYRLARSDMSALVYAADVCAPYFYDLVATDDQVIGVKRGGAIIATLTDDDFAEVEPDEDETRNQQVEYPGLVTVFSPDPDENYVNTPQPAARESPNVAASSAIKVQSIIPMSKDFKAQLANALQKQAFAKAEGGLKRTLRRKWMHLKPADCFEYNSRRYMITKARRSKASLYIEADYDRVDSYDLIGTGVTGPAVQAPTSNIKGPTVFSALNLSSLRDADNSPGMYLFAMGLLPGWPGAYIYLSLNGGTSFAKVATLTVPSVMGELMAAIGTSTEPINVQIYGTGELASVTDAEIAARANGFAIDSGGVPEIGQVKTVTDNGLGTYGLTDVSRGEHFTDAATHAAGDLFVMLDNAFHLDIALDYADTDLIFKVVTIGTPYDAGPEYTVHYETPEYIEDGGTPG